MKQPVSFYSEGVRLVGDVYHPEGVPPGERRAAIVLCHGDTGVKDLYLPDNARVLNAAGYVVLTLPDRAACRAQRLRALPGLRGAGVQRGHARGGGLVPRVPAGQARMIYAPAFARTLAMGHTLWTQTEPSFT
jgi:hypothetical protein